MGSTGSSAWCDVLVVEDDADIRATLEAVLGDEGYTVVTACNGREGLDRLEAGARPSLILLDMMMPVMDGEQFLSRLRAGDSRTPVVVVTASPKRAVPGATALLRKPIELEELFSLVRQYCSGSTALPMAAQA